MSEIKNAKIISTMLGYEGHGIFTLYIDVKGDHWDCSFGGYGLDEYNKEKDKRIGHSYGIEFLKEILKIAGVEKYEDLRGKYIRVDGADLGSTIKRIGHIIDDLWFDPKELARNLLPEPPKEE